MLQATQKKYQGAMIKDLMEVLSEKANYKLNQKLGWDNKAFNEAIPMEPRAYLLLDEIEYPYETYAIKCDSVDLIEKAADQIIEDILDKASLNLLVHIRQPIFIQRDDTSKNMKVTCRVAFVPEDKFKIKIT